MMFWWGGGRISVHYAEVAGGTAWAQSSAGESFVRAGVLIDLSGSGRSESPENWSSTLRRRISSSCPRRQWPRSPARGAAIAR